jgi:hypothetical protein
MHPLKREAAGCWIVGLALFGLSFASGCHSGGSPAGNPVEIDRLRFTMPSSWRRVPPTSSMRAAQAVIPGPAGDAELAVFFFGVGAGGSVEANLQRWMNQIIPDGGGAPQRETFESRGLRITWVDAHGLLKPGEMGMGPAAPQLNTRLLGAVIEGEGGPWFFKATGPEATLAPQRDAFIAMLHSAQLSGG